MKKTITLIAAIALLSVFTACNDDKKETATNVVIAQETVAEMPEMNANKSDFVYVTAPSGLSLREYNNLDSEKLTVMPYGTQVKLVSIEENETMTVGGIKGGMNQIKYNNKTGYAFNGYLSSFFPPEKNSNAKQYIEDLKATHPTATYTKTTGGTASNPSETITVLLPTTKWHEGFIVAQRLFDVPLAFGYPSPKGLDTQMLANPKQAVYMHLSELNISRIDNDFKEIRYVQEEEGHENTVTIVLEEGMMKIESVTVVD